MNEDMLGHHARKLVRDRIGVLEAENVRLRAAVEAAHTRETVYRTALSVAQKAFKEYAALHRTKGTKEGNNKAYRNDGYAMICGAALAEVPPREG